MREFYAAKYGRPSLTPGMYFRSLLIGYFEGIEAERGIAWRLADSLALRRFCGIGLDEYTPDHSTISRTRRLIDRGDASRSVHLGAGGAGGARTAEGQADRDRCDDAGSERGDALDCAARHGRELRGVSDAAGEGLGDRDADAGRAWRGWIASARSARRTRIGRARGRGCAHHEDEGRAHAPGAQGRARGRSGHGRGGGGDAARRRRGRHDDAATRRCARPGWQWRSRSGARRSCGPTKRRR